ncbi:uncharacterized protein [Macrobrachium rosenbergii]|uniref:uncharacterized protein n=1 Tax=Macrobrachium rosenbergii TaxID=79674 RepID=UPI0034D6F5F2
MVERFHRSLRVSLMACCTAENLKYQLPWVLLGLRTAPRANGDLSAAEKVFGESLIVPGELITEDRDDLTMQRLRNRFGKFAPCRRTYTDRTSPFMPPGLSSATHVFVRNDAVRPPLTRPYRGPFLVLERKKKAFRMAMHWKEDRVLIDRLKPSFLEEDVGGTSQSPRRRWRPLSPPHPQENIVGAPGPGRQESNPTLPSTGHPQDTEEVEHTPQLASRRRGPLCCPSRYLL